MNMNISLNRDIDIAIKILGKPKFFIFNRKKLEYQFQIVEGILKIRAKNRTGEVFITPNSVDMVKKRICIQNQVYRYEEIKWEN